MSSTSEWTPSPSPPGASQGPWHSSNTRATNLRSPHTAPAQSAETSAPPSSSPESSPPAPTPKSSRKEWRRGKWTDEESAEVLFIGDRYLESTSKTPAGRVEDWESLRDKFKTHAKGRSVNALRGKYLALIKKREKNQGKEGEEGQSPAHDDDVIIVEPSGGHGSAQAQSHPPFSPRSQSIIERGTAAAVAYVSGNRTDPFQLVAPSAPPPWTAAEDAALLATLATMPLGPMRWPNVYSMLKRTYEKSEQRQFLRTQEEVQIRWDTRWSKQAFWANVPPSLAAPINLITQQLGQAVLEFLATSDAAFARNIIESIGGAAFTPVKPAVAPTLPTQTPVQPGPSQFALQPGPAPFRRPSISLPPAPNVVAYMQGLAASPTPAAAPRPPASNARDATNTMTQVQRTTSTGTLPQQLSSPPASASHLTPGRAAPPFPYRPSPTFASATISPTRSAPNSSLDGHETWSVPGAEDGEHSIVASPGSVAADSGVAAPRANQAGGGILGAVRRAEDEPGGKPESKRTRTA